MVSVSRNYTLRKTRKNFETVFSWLKSSHWIDLRIRVTKGVWHGVRSQYAPEDRSGGGLGTLVRRLTKSKRKPLHRQLNCFDAKSEKNIRLCFSLLCLLFFFLQNKQNYELFTLDIPWSNE